MATPGFGFSIGDFIAGIQLAIDIASALNDSAGAIPDIKSFYGELQVLQTAVLQIKASHFGESDPLYTTAGLALNNCYTLIKEFLDKHKKYFDLIRTEDKAKPNNKPDTKPDIPSNTKSNTQSNTQPNTQSNTQSNTQPNTQSHVHGKTLLKIKWALLHKEDVQNLRTKLAGQAAPINLLLSAINLRHSRDASSSIDTQLNEQSTKINALTKHLEETRINLRRSRDANSSIDTQLKEQSAIINDITRHLEETGTNNAIQTELLTRIEQLVLAPPRDAISSIDTQLKEQSAIIYDIFRHLEETGTNHAIQTEILTRIEQLVLAPPKDANSSIDTQLKELSAIITDMARHLEETGTNHAIQTELLTRIEQLVLAPPQHARTVEPTLDFEVRPLKLIGAPTVVPDHVVERVYLMSEIAGALDRSTDHAQRSARRRIVVLQGMGGIGKSELARSYAYKYEHCYSAVFWLNAKEKQTLRLGVAQLAEQIPLPGVLDASRQIRKDEAGINLAADAVLEWLSHRLNTGWLLIFDNVDSQIIHDNEGVNDESTPASTYFDARTCIPNISHGSILLTSRLSYLDRVFGAKVIRVEELSENEGADLLRKTSGRSGDEPEIRLLVKKLGAHPLALSQAGRYISSGRITPQGYIEKYDNEFKNLLEQAPCAGEYERGSIRATLGLSFNQVVERNPFAAALLMLCSCLDNSSISGELFNGLSKVRALLFAEGDPLINPHYRGIPNLPVDWLDQLCDDENKYGDAIADLHEFSFVRHNTRSDGVSIHPLIHDWALHYYDPLTIPKNLAAICNILGSNVPQSEPYFKGLPHAQIRNHVDRWVSLLSESFEDIYDASIGGILGMAAYYDVQGPKALAVRLRRFAYDTAKTKFQAEHRCIAEAGIAVAMDCYEAEDWGEAAEIFDLHGPQYSKIYWPQSGLSPQEHEKLSSLLCTSQLVLCYHLMNRRDKFEEARTRFAEIKEELHNDTAIRAVGNWLYFVIQSALEPYINEEGSQALHEKKARRKKIIEESKEMLKIIKNAKKWPPSFGTKEAAEEKLYAVLGRAYIDDGEIEKGQAYLQEAYKLNQRLEGPYSPDNLALANELLYAPRTVNRKMWRQLIFQGLRDMTPLSEERLDNPGTKRKGRSEHPEWARLEWREAIATAFHATKHRPRT